MTHLVLFFLFLVLFLVPVCFFYHEFIFSICRMKKQTVYLGRYENKKYEDMIRKINFSSDLNISNKIKEKEVETRNACCDFEILEKTYFAIKSEEEKEKEIVKEIEIETETGTEKEIETETEK